jgi:hypothetical protein
MPGNVGNGNVGDYGWINFPNVGNVGKEGQNEVLLSWPLIAGKSGLRFTMLYYHSFHFY